ncbi:hypothetical protein FOH10_34280 [Nocardia otitidiscaviarum]|uniref:Uncharacterized protein n=1 Tax=Nocardia otitidiscaviarum TaxID=1823 RepID=A0A516NVV0_9NOCA|nr:hypothetical protein [Nocardia otitidiscaviarum]MCP9622534.1 hypothetical protein [Nocardia otitidiscaviarum]QDP83036.1 hypothetical protein FOH10_34280 [Nocardia otitidiscaviarum]
MEIDETRRKVCLVRVLDGDDWVAAFVIDGRDYDTVEDYERAVTEAARAIDKHWIPAEFETSYIRPGEPRFPQPTWEKYRKSLE